MPHWRSYADLSLGILLAIEVISWLLLPTSPISNYGSVGKYSIDFFVSVTGVRWWTVVGSPCLPLRSAGA